MSCKHGRHAYMVVNSLVSCNYILINDFVHVNLGYKCINLSCWNLRAA